METSAAGAASAETLSMLLSDAGSGVSELTAAVFVRGPVKSATRVALTVTVTTPSAGSTAPREHSSRWSGATVQVPPLSTVAVTSVRAASSWSVTVTAVAGAGPALSTGMVKVTRPPGTRAGGGSGIATERSAQRAAAAGTGEGVSA